MDQHDLAGDEHWFDLLGGEISPSIVKSCHDSDENKDANKQVKMPIFQPTELVGRTLLVEPQEDGQCHRAHIVQAIEEQEDDLAHNSTRIQFLCLINDDKTEETIAYNEVLQNLKGFSFNAMIEWENGESTTQSLAAANDPITCAIYARDHALLMIAGWKCFNGITKCEKKFLRMAN